MEKKPRQKNQWLWPVRIGLLLSVAATLLFIFGRSALSGDASAEESRQAAALLAGGLAPEQTEPLEAFLRKVGHFAEFALLGFLMALALRSFTRRVFAYSGWPLLVGLGAAVLDEAIQVFVPGRSGAVADVLLDFGGVAAGMGCAVVVFAAAVLVRSGRPAAGPQGGPPPG